MPNSDEKTIKLCPNVKSHYFDHEKSSRKEKDKLRV